MSGATLPQEGGGRRAVVSAGRREGDRPAVCPSAAGVGAGSWSLRAHGLCLPPAVDTHSFPAQPCNYEAIRALSLYTRRGCPHSFIFQGWETLSYLRLKPHLGRKRLGVNSTVRCPESLPSLEVRWALVGSRWLGRTKKSPFQPRAAITGRAGPTRNIRVSPSASLPCWPRLHAKS